jgi:predicted molibdopterin-dependent oxidoreductase YjgC
MRITRLTLSIDGLLVTVDEGTTILEAAQMYGIHIPTLCHVDGLSSYGACRLCIVEIGARDRSKAVSSCTYRCEEGLQVWTHSRRVVNARRLLLELMVCSTPDSKTIQDLAAAHGITKQRFRPEAEDCIQCGLCVRMCEEQMMAGAIGFVGHGPDRRITTPFEELSDVCRHCGGCMYICPTCMLRCQGPAADTTPCRACLNLSPSCLATHDQQQCWMPPACGTCLRPEGNYLPATRRTLEKETEPSLEPVLARAPEEKRHVDDAD